VVYSYFDDMREWKLSRLFFWARLNHRVPEGKGQ
jgi:hypothetical protein